MSPPAIQLAPPEASPPQFHPVQFHPEFGYFAPTLAFRHKASLVGKGLAVGLIVGALGAILWPERDSSRARSFFTMHSQAVAGDGLTSTQVRFVAPTLALPAAARAASIRTAAGRAPTEPASLVTIAPDEEPPAVSVPAEQAPPRRPKRKVARQPRRDRDARPMEIDPRGRLDPRDTYAGSSRHYAEPRAQRDFRPFSTFGW